MAHFSTATRSPALRTRAAMSVAALLGVALGCSVPTSSKEGPELAFLEWHAPLVDTCRGVVENTGLSFAPHSRVHLLYATALGETLRIVTPTPEDIDGIYAPADQNRALFSAPVQVTNGEARYPRVGSFSWDGGSSPGQPRSPALSVRNLFRTEGYVYNTGGWAYHVVVTVQNVHGVEVLETSPATFGPTQQGKFTLQNPDTSPTAPRPTVLKLRWEDYGGLRDSVLMPVAL